MGYRSSLDYNSVNHQLWTAGVELNSPYNDGFIQWQLKQDLFRLSWLLDEILKSSPHFGELEDDFITEHQKKVVWRTLQT